MKNSAKTIGVKAVQCVTAPAHIALHIVQATTNAVIGGAKDIVAGAEGVAVHAIDGTPRAAVVAARNKYTNDKTLAVVIKAKEYQVKLQEKTVENWHRVKDATTAAAKRGLADAKDKLARLDRELEFLRSVSAMNAEQRHSLVIESKLNEPAPTPADDTNYQPLMTAVPKDINEMDEARCEFYLGQLRQNREKVMADDLIVAEQKNKLVKSLNKSIAQINAQMKKLAAKTPDQAFA